MANIKSQIKRNKTNEKRRLRNKAVKTEVRTLIRKTREAVEAGNVEEAQEGLRVASRKLDKAVSKGVLHRNNAANRKSKLAKLVATLDS
ncbi:30S ribosomal protein S20 [Trueperella bialowiezensis]|uniref:Small ribosomal subunit protein bS20 n=1 Tax=Trueperella bialowiezensis TaxID=312285 RepID=A0A3S5EW68_9ACTO|nr:30S ribosomal protein S20 [Trueperella bialowiezensis]VEI14098.1 30S ribosomal protein S20 [Trueperella bialowiezensis]